MKLLATILLVIAMLLTFGLGVYLLRWPSTAFASQIYEAPVSADVAVSAWRTKINNSLDALLTNHSGTAEPASPVPFQFWVASTSGELYIRNTNNDGWILIGDITTPGLGIGSSYLPLAGGTMDSGADVSMNSGDWRNAQDVQAATMTTNFIYGGGALWSGNTYTNQGIFHYINNPTNTSYLYYGLNSGYLISPRNWTMDIGSLSGSRMFQITSGGSQRAKIDDLGNAQFDGNADIGGAVISASASLGDASMTGDLTINGHARIKGGAQFNGATSVTTGGLSVGSDVFPYYGVVTRQITGHAGATESGSIQFMDNDGNQADGLSFIDDDYFLGYLSKERGLELTGNGITSSTAYFTAAKVHAAPTDASHVVRLDDLDQRTITPVGPFEITGIARTTATTYTGVWGDSTNSARFYFPYKAKITALSLFFAPAANAGSATATISINGSPDSEIEVVLTSGSYAKDIAGNEVDIAADDYIGVNLDTHSTFNFSPGPPTANCTLTLWAKVGKE